MVQLSGRCPARVLLLDPVLLLLLMSGSRLAYRVWKEHEVYGALRYQGKPVLVLGAGDTALTLLRELERSPAWRVVGFLDDDRRRTAAPLNGVKVWAASPICRDLREDRRAARDRCDARATHEERRSAVQACSDANVKALTVPSYDDLVSGRVTVSALREIELDDLLGRDPVVLDDAAARSPHRPCRDGDRRGRLDRLGALPARSRASAAALVMFELSEYALYSINEELAKDYPALAKVCAIGDVKDEARQPA
jgi:FlaA1/EpsC-like NDP-sugar epimerase